MVGPRSGNSPGALRRGFTLVELLVVVAIVGILLALLLPAIQTVREGARQTQCRSRLRQIGYALTLHHESQGRLPVGCLEWRGGKNTGPSRRQLAWSALILPYLEHNPLAGEIDYDKPFDHPDNAAAARQELPIYHCPSVPDDEQRPRGRSDYGGIFGEQITDRGRRDVENGLLVYERAYSYPQITDGLTNTLIVAENAGGQSGEWINGRNVFLVAFGINDARAPKFDDEIRSRHPTGAMALFVGGRVVMLDNQIDKLLLAALCTRAGGETNHSLP